MSTGRNRTSGRHRRRTGATLRRWRGAFFLAPYLRDTFVACGVLSETFETAITWDRLEEFHATVMETTRRAVAEVTGTSGEGRGAPLVTCRFTHAYPDGVAPYFTVLAPAIRGGEVEQWDEIKAAVSEALIDGGGRSPITTRSAAITVPGTTDSARPLRGRSARRQGRARSGRDPESRRPPRPDPCGRHRAASGAARRYPFATRSGGGITICLAVRRPI